MSFINRNKYHLLGSFAVIVLFIITTFIREENLSTPLSRQHEWITAHTLITCEIWSENGGPSNYHFSPVYTYSGEGNQRRTMLGGVVDEKGDVYYVSYPPFAFLFAYYAMEAIGGPSVDAIRNLNLAIHLLCALFIYLIGVSLSADSQKNMFSIAGIFGAFLYLFSSGNLWIHGNLYFADMLVQLFVISSLYFVIRFFKKDYKNERLFLSILFFLFFLATYTEWLGLFLAFFVGIAFFISYFLVKEKRFIKAFFSVGIAATLALILTIFQYTSIAGWQQLKEVSTAKYQERSGHESAEISANAFNLENDEAFDFLIGNIDSRYKMVENFVGIFLILFIVVVLFRKARKNLVPFQWHSVVFCLFTLSVLIHYYVFFNFNALHNFSSLKTGFLMILLILLFVSLIESMLSNKLKIVLVVLIALLSVDKGLESVNNYIDNNPLTDIDWNRVETGKAIKRYSQPEVAVFLNIPLNPELTYYAGHNLFPIQDTGKVMLLLEHFQNTKGHYYHHTDSKLDYMMEFTKSADSLIISNKIEFNSNYNGSGTHFQK